MKVVVAFVFLLVSCQAGVSPRQLSGVCMEMCSSDADCPSGQHCLSNGCGHICQTRTLTLPIQVSSNDTRLQCAQCDNILQPSDCDYVTRCSPDEQCLVRKHFLFGLTTYIVGCEKTTVCQGKTLAADNFQCCSDNLCNTNTALLSPDFFTPPPPTTTTPPLFGEKKCFACDHQAHPAMCLKLTTCGDHEACYAVKGITHTHGQDYSSGCLVTQDCPKMVRAANHNNYARELCVECCNSDYCNAKLCGAADVLATSLVCYKCEHDNVHNTKECLEMAVCQPDQRCAAEPSVHGNGHTTLGCKRTSDCGVGGVACCNTNFCNLNLTAGSAVTSPATTV